MLSRYILITGVGEATLQTEELSCGSLLENEAVIEAEASMISAGTELSRVFAIKKGFSYPVRPGYSAVGRVVAKGGSLEGIEVGDRVFYSGPHASHCIMKSGERTQGPVIFKLNSSITPKAAAALNLGLVAMNGVCTAKIIPGDTAVVFGLGAIGLLTALLFKEAGARVIGVDPAGARCETAIEMGIGECCNAMPHKQVETVLAMTDGKGADISVDVTGDSRAIANAVFSAARYGQVILLGTPRADCEMNVAPVFNKIHMSMLDVKGAFNNLFPPREAEGCRITSERNLRHVESLMVAGKIDIDKIVSHVIKPEEIQMAYHGLMYDKDNYRCVVIDWTNCI